MATDVLPAHLRSSSPKKVKLVINLKTARALDFTVPLLPIKKPGAASREYLKMETKMQNRLLNLVGVIAVAAFTVHVAIAAPRGARKAVRVSPSVTQQLRNAFGSAPKAVDSKSCDVIWCYEN
jgi:hypothetical protein